MSSQMPNSIIKQKSSYKLNVKVIIVKEDNYFTAYCPALEVSGYADTIEKAKVSFDQEMKIFLYETAVRGTLEKYLLKLGWTLRQIPTINYIPPEEQIKQVPISFQTYGKVVEQEISIPVY